MTDFIKKSEQRNNWVLINAENAIVGRLAAFISKTLRGKNKSQYTPNMDMVILLLLQILKKLDLQAKNLLIKNIIGTQDTQVELKILLLQH